MNLTRACLYAAEINQYMYTSFWASEHLFHNSFNLAITSVALYSGKRAKKEQKTTVIPVREKYSKHRLQRNEIFLFECSTMVELIYF